MLDTLQVMILVRHVRYLAGVPGTTSWCTAPGAEQVEAEVVEVPVVLEVFREGCGEEDAEDRPPAEETSGLVTTRSFMDCRFLAIFRNLWMIRVLRMARVMMGPTLRKISLITRYILKM